MVKTLLVRLESMEGKLKETHRKLALCRKNLELTKVENILYKQTLSKRNTFIISNKKKV